jgi:lipoic acid synthetase
MLMGDLCTRNCRFCAVASSRQGRELRPDEGAAITRAARELELSYVVLTSVDRDDLDDRGAGHFASCVTALKAGIPGIKIELLTPDYTQAELAGIAGAAPHVLAHNVETVRAFQWVRASRASFDASLATLRAAKALGIKVTKSSLLLGLGETGNAVLSAMDELREAGVDILVMGQYLRPSKKQIPVAEYISPAQFDAYAEEGRNRGFASVVASPFARTSYHAAAAAREILGEEAAGGRHAD